MPSPLTTLLLRRRDSTSESAPRPIDVLAAIRARWVGDSALTQISPELYLDRGPKTPAYPFVVISQKGELYSGNTGRGYVERKVFQFALYHTDLDVLGNYSDIVTNSYDPLNRTKALYFSNGYLMGFRRTGGNVARMPNVAAGATGYVYQQIYMYMVTVGRTSLS